MTEPEHLRWTETDWWGQPVHCAEATWYRKLVGEQRPELATHEDVIRETIRDPQWLMVGYVRTMYLPRSLRGKLELRWEREMP